MDLAQLRVAGVDARGCDLYPADRSRSVLATELGIVAISPMVEGKIPFPDNYFDCVVSNMVFEHVVDIDLALDEIARVLRPGGEFLCLFPDLGVIREDHTGIHSSYEFYLLSSSKLRGFQTGFFSEPLPSY